jgi:hypothetical protein
MSPAVKHIIGLINPNNLEYEVNEAAVAPSFNMQYDRFRMNSCLWVWNNKALLQSAIS